MTELVDVQWPPSPISTSRLVLRPTQARDREGYLDLLCSDEVRRYLGGAHQRAELEQAVPAVPGAYPGVFAVETGDAFIGTVTLNRRDVARLGHVRPEGEEVEVSYTFLPAHWGLGYASEAVATALHWAEIALPSEPVVLCTQSANERSVHLASRLGFQETERFVEFGAEQWFGVRLP